MVADRQAWQLHVKKTSQNCFHQVCVVTVFTSACLFVLFIELTAAAVVQSFWQPSSSFTWWQGHVLSINGGLPLATYVAMFHCTCCKILVQAIRVYFGSHLQTFLVQKSYLLMWS